MKRVMGHVLAAAVLAGSVFAGQLSTTPVSNMSTGWWRIRFRENLTKAKQGPYDIAFLGDSITDFWRSRGKAEFEKFFGGYKTFNMGYSGDRTEQVLWRLDNGELDGVRPKLIVLMIGTNNTGHRRGREKPQDTVDGVKAILGRIAKKSPGSRVLLLAIFPRGAAPGDPLRRQNDAVNAGLKKLADSRRVFWMDIGGRFLLPDGALPRAVMPDLLHPNAKGYEIWAEAILPFVQKTVRASVTPAGRTELKWWADRWAAKQALAKQGGWDFVFLGDSIIHGWEGAGRGVWEKRFAPYRVLNMGFSGDRTEHVLWRLDNGALDGLSPKAVFLMIGTNNTGHNPETLERPEDTAAGIKAILGRIEAKAPGAAVVLMPIFPRGATPADAKRVRNERVNALIRPFADGEKVVWLDFNKEFLLPDGTLPRGIMPDLLHPNAKGYEIWARAVLPLMRRFGPAKSRP